MLPSAMLHKGGNQSRRSVLWCIEEADLSFRPVQLCFGVGNLFLYLVPMSAGMGVESLRLALWYTAGWGDGVPTPCADVLRCGEHLPLPCAVVQTGGELVPAPCAMVHKGGGPVPPPCAVVHMGGDLIPPPGAMVRRGGDPVPPPCADVIRGAEPSPTAVRRGVQGRGTCSSAPR